MATATARYRPLPMMLIEGVVALFAAHAVGCAAAPENRSASSVRNVSSPEKKLVIAHRGASGYLPEHTLAAKAVAHAQGADFIEQDLVMTEDDRVIVLHDHHLDAVTDVRRVFPDRSREDGRYYVIDFSLEEIRQLSVFERFSVVDGAEVPVIDGRFPFGKSAFGVHTLEEEIELIQGLNSSSGRSVGIYPEIKSPAFHQKEGKDISTQVLSILKAYGYTDSTDNIYLQCFDTLELERIHDDLMPKMDMTLRLIQLANTSPHYEWILGEGGIERLTRFAHGLGPSMNLLIDRDSPESDLRVSSLLSLAHDAGLKVHPYTFRREISGIPGYARSYEDLLDIFLYRLGVDGVFTDFPDLTVRFIETAESSRQAE